MQELITVQQMADELGVSAQTVMAWLRRGDLPESATRKIGKFWYISRPEFMAWFKTREG